MADKASSVGFHVVFIKTYSSICSSGCWPQCLFHVHLLKSLRRRPVICRATALSASLLLSQYFITVTDLGCDAEKCKAEAPSVEQIV